MGQFVEFPAIVYHCWSFARQAIIGTGLAQSKAMKFFCRHCDEIAVGEPYRVISEEGGVILLNMTVCRPCSEQARTLGLRSEAVRAGKQNRHGPRMSHAQPLPG
jgi:hypothetical protein